jgi:hypothetical protein
MHATHWSRFLGFKGARGRARPAAPTFERERPSSSSSSRNQTCGAAAMPRALANPGVCKMSSQMK